MYETRKAFKEKIIESELYKADIAGFNSKVGFLTNLSTTMYAMLPLYKEGSAEYKEIIRRLKQCRKEQGAIIDATKGLVIKPIPGHWTNWQKNEEDDEELAFENSILIEKRPQFMQHLYQEYNRKYQRHFDNYNTYCIARFGTELESLLVRDTKELSDDEKMFLDKYFKYSPLLNTNCNMNRVNEYMQEEIKKIIHKANSISSDKEAILIRQLKSPDFDLNKVKLDKLHSIYKKYKSGKRNFGKIENDDGDKKFKTVEQYNKFILQESLGISSDICELASLAVVICYELYPSDNKSFVWNIFGEGIIENLLRNNDNKIYIPFYTENGDIKWLGEHYSKKEIAINEPYDFL